MDHHSSASALSNSSVPFSPDTDPVVPPTSWHRLILTWLAWLILISLGWATIPLAAAVFAFVAEDSSPIQPRLLVNIGVSLALIWLVIGGLQVLCLARYMRGTAWWQVRWLGITVASGVGLSLLIVMSNHSLFFLFDLSFILAYVVWSVVTGAGQWLALQGRLRRLPRRDLFIWLCIHFLVPVVVILLLRYLWLQLPGDLDTPITLWHYFIGILSVIGPGLLHGVITSAILLLLLRRAWQSSFN